MSEIGYVYSTKLRKHCDKLPKMRFRSSIVQALINSYKLLDNNKVKILHPLPATDEELKIFHSSDYIDFLKYYRYNHEESGDYTDFSKYYKSNPAEMEVLLEKFGLMYDCPILEDMYDFARTIAGGTLTAAKYLVETDSKIAINWYGGWHHAQRNNAEGFCYINDIVIGIHKLQEKFEKILYVDFDVHHGNGVQNAFEFNNTVMTFSIHKLSPGFYPGSGLLDETGTNEGKNYALNIPLKEGISDATYRKIFHDIFPKLVKCFGPNAMVVQCGADILSGDPIGGCNATLNVLGSCVKDIAKYKIPVLFLGGGGYNFTNTARYWTYLTSIILDQPIEEEIPDNIFFTEYGPTYELIIYPTNRKDENSDEYISQLITHADAVLNEIKQMEG